MTPEPNSVAFIHKTENARTFKINPLEEIVVTVPSELTNQLFCRVEHRSAPNAAPPLHIHRNEDEIFEILEGQFRFWLDGEIVEASQGTIIVAPRNGTHTWKNVGGIPGRMSVTFIPGGLDGFFHDMEKIPHTDPRAPIIAEGYGVVYVAPAPEALDIAPSE
jgi:mannose-6-phosphate isomerase-like protein (cupin superfamily)